MKNIHFAIAAMLCAWTVTSYADAVMRPGSPEYSGDLLYHKSTNVSVIVHGPVVETIVSSEFINQWSKVTSAVYSFPVPEDASVSGLWYQFKGAYYKAVLKEVPQVTNPGTGEGGFAAELNQYLGKNSVSVKIDSIMPGTVQRVELRYIQCIPFSSGVFTYSCPLDMKSIYEYPVDLLEFDVRLYNQPAITSFHCASHPDGWVNVDSLGTYKAYHRQDSKVYLQNDLTFTYSVNCPALSAQIFGGFDTSKTGYFFTSILPQSTMPVDSSFPKNVAFLIDMSNSMRGFKLQQSCEAVKACIASLHSRDRFCLGVFDQTTSVPLHSQTVSGAAQSRVAILLDSISSISGLSASYLQTAVNTIMPEFSYSSFNNEILLFTDGFAACTPEDIVNTKHAGIFPIGLGEDVSRARLEAIAFAHNGFATFFKDDDAIAQGVVSVFASISSPIVKSASLSWEGAGMTDVLPAVNNYAFYQGLGYSLSGKYASPTTAAFGMKGIGISGPATYFFDAKFPSDTLTDETMFVQRLWASEKIQALERDIEVYGKQADLRPTVVAMSLAYGVKSRFTSYWADHDAVNVDNPPKGVAPTERGEVASALHQESFSLSVNHASGVLRVSLSIGALHVGQTAVVQIFDARGRLVAMLFHGRIVASGQVMTWNYKLMGAQSGVYFVKVSVGNTIMTKSVFLK
jgi:Vault protein inter-alpha-trypsin./von Willebrand factor type A domain.